MHINLLHAVITGGLIYATIWGMRRFGLADADHKGFDWKLFAGIAVVVFVFNLIWPA